MIDDIVRVVGSYRDLSKTNFHQEALDGKWRHQMQMPRRLETSPVFFEDAVAPTSTIGRGQGQCSARLQNTQAFLQYLQRIRNVFDYMIQGHRIVRVGLKLLVQQRSFKHPETSLAGDSNCVLIKINAFDLPSEFAHECQPFSGTTSNIQ